MFDVPESKLAALRDHIGDFEEYFDFTEFAIKAIAEAIEDTAKIWPADTETGIGFYAAIGTLWADESLNTKSEITTLQSLVETHYLCDDDSGWRRAEKLGLELKLLADQLLASAERGKARWPDDDD